MKDKDLLQHYVKLAEILGEMFAPVLEVIVHDYRKPDSSVIAIFNGHITGRKVGDPATDIGYRRLKGEDIPEVIINYENEGIRGNKLKSSTMAVRNPKGKLIGGIGFNLDITLFEQFQRFIEQFISSQKNSFIEGKEKFHCKTPKEELQEAIHTLLIQKGWYATSLSYKDKKDVVKDLYLQGHFNKRAVVTILADILKVTRASIYRYIKEV
jgi:predicted transcriptional regulator YheO